MCHYSKIIIIIVKVRHMTFLQYKSILIGALTRIFSSEQNCLTFMYGKLYFKTGLILDLLSRVVRWNLIDPGGG